ncbi:MAG: hypothetical protein Q9162_000576 [Coniocarpon cinnabarinum]
MSRQSAHSVSSSSLQQKTTRSPSPTHRKKPPAKAVEPTEVSADNKRLKTKPPAESTTIERGNSLNKIDVTDIKSSIDALKKNLACDKVAKEHRKNDNSCKRKSEVKGGTPVETDINLNLSREDATEVFGHAHRLLLDLQVPVPVVVSQALKSLVRDGDSPNSPCKVGYVPTMADQKDASASRSRATPSWKSSDLVGLYLKGMIFCTGLTLMIAIVRGALQRSTTGQSPGHRSEDEKESSKRLQGRMAGGKERDENGRAGTWYWAGSSK